MDTATITVSFIVTILGIAYPILIQVTSRLDEKYSSILVLELFNKENERKIFKVLLIIALISILIYILKLPPLIQIDGLNLIINNSALILLTLSATVLVISFFFFVEKILIYYTPKRFLRYLISKHEGNDGKYEYFKTISDILYDSIKKQNESITKTISEFLYSAFQKERDKEKSTPIVYPISFYEVVYRSIEELVYLKGNRLSLLEQRTTSGIWLFGELGNSTIADQTYMWIWRNLLFAIKHERDDMIMHYWENAHQYFSRHLRIVYPRYSDTTHRIINEKEIKDREIERNRFLEFHFALGGLLLYRKRYYCIGRTFNYTTSIPPRYELLPQTMGEIFNRYIEFKDPYEQKYAFISHLYPFPELEGLNADYTIKKWILKYIGVLFIRQYSIQPHLITMTPLKLPTIPKTQREKKLWLDNINYFKEVVEEVFNNQELLIKTKLGFITPEWLAEQEKPNPIGLINLYETQIQSDFEKTEIGQEISKIKEDEFKNASVKIIKPTLELYTSTLNPTIIENNFNNWFIHGERIVMDKSAFSDDADSQHINFDSFTAEHISTKIKNGISETFYYSKSNLYLLNPKDIFPAIQKLGINNEYVIICFDQNLEWFKKAFALEGLTNDSYNGIKLIQFTNSNYHLVGHAFFVIKKSELPNIIHHSINDEEIEKYELKPIDEEIKLYSSIVNLNKRDDLIEELEPFHEDRNLRKSVLVNLGLKVEIRWKKSVNNIMFKTSSQFRENGVPHSLNDVKKLD